MIQKEEFNKALELLDEIEEKIRSANGLNQNITTNLIEDNTSKETN